MKSAVLLTGATGFIGSHIADAMLSRGGPRLVTIAREAGGYKNTGHLSSAGARVYAGSFNDPSLVNSALRENGVQAIVHCAALRGGGAGTADEYDGINVKGTEILLEAASRNGVGRFVYISSVGVHGTIPSCLPAGPGAAFNGDNLYHASKLAAEEKVRECALQGLDAVILRPTITYGRGDDGFPTTLIALVKRRLIPVPMRSVLIHLLDVRAIASLVRGIIMSEKRCGGAYIVADAAPVLLGDLVDLIHRRMYGSPYPRMLRAPACLYDLAAAACAGLGNEKWEARFKLISRSWYYDISDTISAFEYNPSKTEDAFMDSVI